MSFLPVTRDEMNRLGWKQADFIVVSGDAYVDHPSFGAAIISRLIESRGFNTAFLSQPDWKNTSSFSALGKPKYAFFVSSGNVDSMVAHYTVAKLPRKTDAYSPGGITGLRPDRAVLVYTKILKKLYPDVPVIIGGLEASLRRFANYDYWDNTVHPSILIESGADLLSFGMSETQTADIAKRLAQGESVESIRDVRGTCYVCDVHDTPFEGKECPSYENVSSSKKEYAAACRIQLDEQDHIIGKAIKQKHSKLMLVQNKPAVPLSREELDKIYDLPFERAYHPMYEKDGGVPGIEEVKFSIAHNRGCFGACNFCAISLHQGRFVTSRSKESILSEAKKITQMPDFKGYINDIGGPTANFRLPSCEKQKKSGLCKGKKCLAPVPCNNLTVDHSEYLDILRSVRALPEIKKVFIRSGIRYDYLLLDKDDSFLKELIKYHVSGQLKVAPEHCVNSVLDYMGKPHIDAYKEFSKKYFSLSDKAGKEQYLVPYLMSSHPGSTLGDAIELALFLKKQGIRPEQVQDFYPTPGTLSTCMYYTGLDPYTMKEVYVAKSKEEKAMQRALLQYYNPKNKNIIIAALKKARRYDLIGQGSTCLVNVPQERHKPKNYGKKYSGR